jgi:hypothetical protein
MTALDVDWEAIKAHALIHGVRQAARDFGLKEDAVKRKCTLQGWLKPVANEDGSTTVPHLPVTVVPRHVPGVPKASVAARTAMSRLSERSRLNLAKAVDRGAKHAAKLDGEAILERAPAIKSLADTGDKVHQWSASPATPVLRLELIAGARGELPQLPPELDVPMEVSRIPAGEE